MSVRVILTMLALVAAPLPSLAQSADFAATAASQAAANAEPGPRSVPARKLPVPQAVSPAARALIAAPYQSFWNQSPTTNDGWRTLVRESAAAALPGLRELRKTLGVTLEPTTIGGVPGFILTPKNIPAAHRDQIIYTLHGGGYIYAPGASGTLEATLMAAYGGYKVTEVDYRMPPDAPYPAAVEDALAGYKGVLATTDPAQVAVIGTSTGGGLTLALMLRAKTVGVPLPAAMAPNSPWADLTETGDSYKANEWVDNSVVSYSGYLRHAVALLR